MKNFQTLLYEVHPSGKHLHIFQNNHLSTKQFLAGAIIAIIGTFAIGTFTYHVGIWDFFLNRTFYHTAGGLMASTRFYALQDMFLSSHSVIGILFGEGMAQVENYLPGFARMYLYLGLNGLLLIAFFLFRMYTRQTLLQKNILLLFLFLNLGTESILGAFAMLYLCLIVTPYTENTQNISPLGTHTQPLPTGKQI